MTLTDIQILFAYNNWANHKILVATARVTEEQFLAKTTHNYASLRGELTHLLDSEAGWRNVCQHGTTDYFDALNEDSFPTFEALQESWNREERAMRSYLATLTDADMTSHVRYLNDEGVTRERVLWHCLWHVVNHATQHRSEAAVLLTDYGSSPGELDFTVFLNENP